VGSVSVPFGRVGHVVVSCLVGALVVLAVSVVVWSSRCGWVFGVSGCLGRGVVSCLVGASVLLAASVAFRPPRHRCWP